MTKGHIILADDDGAVRTVVRRALLRAGYEVTALSNLDRLRALVEQGKGDAVITDVLFPDGDGLDIVPTLLAKRPDLPIIVISAQNTLTTAVRAAKSKAFEYFSKPFDMDELVASVDQALSAKAVPAPPAPPVLESDLPLIGRSPAMQDCYRSIARIVPTDLTVLILGESGTGKELVASAIHKMGPRRDGPFIALNMAAIPRELIEAELFGHERGAFTGATQRNEGRFEQAQGGTLFLDEIGDMPLDVQTRLLRVLQSGEFYSIGSRRAQQADVRIVAATHQDLRLAIEQGRFREDLFYRINVMPIALPPLRDRGDDIAELAWYFLDRAAASGLPHKHLDASAIAALNAYAWPGNVRELENLMRRLAVMTREATISERDVTQVLQESGADPTLPAFSAGADSLRETLDACVMHYAHMALKNPVQNDIHAQIVHQVERPLFEACLQFYQGNQMAVARRLGINRNTLRKKLNELKVDPHIWKKQES